MLVACIIPSTCGEKVLPLLKRSIKSLLENRTRSIKLKIIICSEFKVDRKVVKGLGKVTLLKTKKKDGFSGMNNLGISYAVKYNPDYILFLNDDAYVSNGFFKIFSKKAEKTNADIVVPKVLKVSGGVDSFGAMYFSSGFARNFRSISIKDGNKIFPANCIFYKTSFLKKIYRNFGCYFNPILKFYFEDVELSIRANNFKPLVIKEKKLVVFHHVSFSSIRKSYFRTFYSYRNIIWLIIMNWPQEVIVKNFYKICLFQIMAMLKSLYYFGPKLYAEIAMSTIVNFRDLINFRKTNLKAYNLDFNFESMLNKHFYQSEHGKYY